MQDTELLHATLRARGVSHLLAVLWDTNRAAVRGLTNAGAQRLGRGFWEYPDHASGWCEIRLVPIPSGFDMANDTA